MAQSQEISARLQLGRGRFDAAVDLDARLGGTLLVMPALAYGKQRTGCELGSEALRADAAETWVCSYLSLALLMGVGLYAACGWWWADLVGALAMLPMILWQGWETSGEARE